MEAATHRRPVVIDATDVGRPGQPPRVGLGVDQGGVDLVGRDVELAGRSGHGSGGTVFGPVAFGRSFTAAMTVVGPGGVSGILTVGPVGSRHLVLDGSARGLIALAARLAIWVTGAAFLGHQASSLGRHVATLGGTPADPMSSLAYAPGSSAGRLSQPASGTWRPCLSSVLCHPRHVWLLRCLSLATRSRVGSSTDCSISPDDRHSAPPPLVEGPDPIHDEDLRLALYVIYEPSYRGFEGVDEERERLPLIVPVRRHLESQFEFEASHRRCYGSPACDAR